MLSMEEKQKELRKDSEKLFSEVDNTEHVYTTDYSVNERASALFDVNEEYFALITHRSTWDEETSAGWSVSSDSWCQGYLYSKRNPQPAKPIQRYFSMMPSEELEQLRREVLSAKKESDLVSIIKSKTNTPNIRQVEEINLGVGRIYISEGNLLLDRIS